MYTGFYATRTGMKIHRARAFFKLMGTDFIFKPFNVSSYHPLQAVLATGQVDENMMLMVFAVGQQTLALVMKQMAYHHVAQGELNGHAWTAFFCAGCNMGTAITPIINGRVHHFRVTGIYNAMSVMSDYETESSWEHVTGECIQGKLRGTHLTAHTPQYLTVGQALDFAPDAQIAISKSSRLAHLLDLALLNRMSALTGYMPGVFRLSMTRVDTRLPELELGLGVWIGGAARFYPLKTIKAQGDFLMDTLNSQPLVIYLDPVSGVPAVHCTTSQVHRWDGDTLVLESGERLRSGYVLNQNVQKSPLNAPYHQFTRWYGFSYMFPSCEIFSFNS